MVSGCPIPKMYVKTRQKALIVEVELTSNMAFKGNFGKSRVKFEKSNLFIKLNITSTVYTIWMSNP